jgi:acyl-CoA reductase-like NAD-dependent aldehyde dehydrogenase
VNRHFIGGDWVDSSTGETLDRLSPAHGLPVSRSALGGEAEAVAAIAAARAAFDDGRWSDLPGRDRARILLRAADLIENRADEMALIETLETGKPITQARGEVTGAADLWRYAASLARTVQGDSHDTLGRDILAVVLKEPIGVVSIITPWNFPFWILSQKLPFALAAGCTCVVKPSEMTPSTTVMMAAILAEAGLSFLGFGVQPPQATWGNIIADGKTYILDAWWLILFPGLAILLAALSFYLTGDALRQAVETRSERQ